MYIKVGSDKAIQLPEEVINARTLTGGDGAGAKCVRHARKILLESYEKLSCEGREPGTYRVLGSAHLKFLGKVRGKVNQVIAGSLTCEAQVTSKTSILDQTKKVIPAID